MNKFIKSTLAVAMVSVALGGVALAASTPGQPGLKHQTWSWTGPFGGYDKEQLKRGWQIYSEVCASCHPVKHLYYRDLMKIGIPEDEVKEIASQYEVEDGPDENGDTFMRPARLSDKIVQPYPNDEAAKAANMGALPPDLSLITKARKGGADYVFGIQTGYEDEPPQWWIDANTDKATGEVADFPEDKYFNTYFDGHAISMAPQFVDMVEFPDGTSPTQEEGLKDVITFLNWAAEPTLEERKSLGWKVILFLAVLTSFLYGLKVYIWRDVEH